MKIIKLVNHSLSELIKANSFSSPVSMRSNTLNLILEDNSGIIYFKFSKILYIFSLKSDLELLNSYLQILNK